MTKRPQYTVQDVFNMAWRHFVVEKGPQSIGRKSGQCLYRGPRGSKCAIGLFLTDEDVDSKNRATIQHLFDTGVLQRYGFNYIHDYSELRAIQNAHDNPSPECFSAFIERNLRSVASDFHLTIPEVAHA